MKLTEEINKRIFRYLSETTPKKILGGILLCLILADLALYYFGAISQENSAIAIIIIFLLFILVE